MKISIIQSLAYFEGYIIDILEFLDKKVKWNIDVMLKCWKNRRKVICIILIIAIDKINNNHNGLAKFSKIPAEGQWEKINWFTLPSLRYN